MKFLLVSVFVLGSFSSFAGELSPKLKDGVYSTYNNDYWGRWENSFCDHQILVNSDGSIIINPNSGCAYDDKVKNLSLQKQEDGTFKGKASYLTFIVEARDEISYKLTVDEGHQKKSTIQVLKTKYCK